MSKVKWELIARVTCAEETGAQVTTGIYETDKAGFNHKIFELCASVDTIGKNAVIREVVDLLRREDAPAVIMIPGTRRALADLLDPECWATAGRKKKNASDPHLASFWASLVASGLTRGQADDELLSRGVGRHRLQRLKATFRKFIEKQIATYTPGK